MHQYCCCCCCRPPWLQLLTTCVSLWGQISRTAFSTRGGGQSRANPLCRASSHIYRSHPQGGPSTWGPQESELRHCKEVAQRITLHVKSPLAKRNLTTIDSFCPVCRLSARRGAAAGAPPWSSKGSAAPASSPARSGPEVGKGRPARIALRAVVGGSESQTTDQQLQQLKASPGSVDPGSVDRGQNASYGLACGHGHACARKHMNACCVCARPRSFVCSRSILQLGKRPKRTRKLLNKYSRKHVLSIARAPAAKCGPNCVEFGQSRPHLDQLWLWPNLAQIWPTLARLGHIVAELEEAGARTILRKSSRGVCVSSTFGVLSGHVCKDRRRVMWW